MSDEIIYDQALMLAKLPCHKEKGKEYIFMPRYAYIGKLLQWYKYNQKELALIQKEIDAIEPYKDHDD